MYTKYGYKSFRNCFGILSYVLSDACKRGALRHVTVLYFDFSWKLLDTQFVMNEKTRSMYRKIIFYDT